jgi:hypothetical protein
LALPEGSERIDSLFVAAAMIAPIPAQSGTANGVREARLLFLLIHRLNADVRSFTLSLAMH